MSGTLTPTKITAWLDCAHYLTLSDRLAAGSITKDELGSAGSMAQMLKEKGVVHEQHLLAAYRSQGLNVFDAGDLRSPYMSFEEWVKQCDDVLDAGHDVVFQMPFIHDGMRGVADFLERIDDRTGTPAYEPVDAKLARNEAKPGHVLQLCFYADAIEEQTGHRPIDVHVALGSGRRESVRLASVDAYWRRLRSQLDTALAAGTAADTRPQPCSHCDFCEFRPVCDQRWRDEDSLVFVANLRADDRSGLETAEVTTMQQLSSIEHSVEEIEQARLDRAAAQAALQVESRDAPGDRPAFRVLEIDTDAAEAVGLGLLPEPNEGDVFLDFEGHPFWQPDAELFFLFGLIEADRSAANGWTFREWWAHSKDEERGAVGALISYLVDRRERFPDMHVYHYNHTERSGLERLTDQHVSGVDLDVLIQTGVFVDLYRVVLGAVQIGAESYSLKEAEKLTGYVRVAGIDKGAGAVVEYEAWMADGDDVRLEKIRAYNDDDVRATRAVRDWLIAQRPDGISWRSSVFERPEADMELDDRVRRLHEFPPGTTENLMGDLLGYWRREKRAVSSRVLTQATAELAAQTNVPGTICGLSVAGIDRAVSARTGKPLSWVKAKLTYPPQIVGDDIEEGARLVEVMSDNEWAFFDVLSADHAKRQVEVKWPKDRDESIHPSVLIEYDWVTEGAKGEALVAVADDLLGGQQRALVRNILRRTPPHFSATQGPANGTFSPSRSDIFRWSAQLADQVVPIQGPPGTGKTFTGSHVVRHLAKTGKRVGIVAMSHHAITNLVEAVVERYGEVGDTKSLRLVQKTADGKTNLDHITATTSNKKAADPDFEIVAGTPWLFAHNEMQANPVDVLVVDEAGQLGLADLVANSVSAGSMILLGDPQQLPQVAQAKHPNGSGASALQHIVGQSAAVESHQGVLLDVTYRMHPDICGYISDVMYDGRLTTNEASAGQDTAEGTGLRWIRSNHTGRTNESIEEADLIVQEISRLLGKSWTDQKGDVRPLTAEDFVVVAPYNQQRRAIEGRVANNPLTRGVRVGTVDKFQGREAAVVFFSMTSSSQADMPRGVDFLFSMNRLNVAISRARCLAYLVGTDEILNTSARNVEEMQMVSAVNLLVEQALAI